MKHKRRACGDVRRARVQNTTDSADSRGRQKKCIVLITSKRVMLITSPQSPPLKKQSMHSLRHRRTRTSLEMRRNTTDTKFTNKNQVFI